VPTSGHLSDVDARGRADPAFIFSGRDVEAAKHSLAAASADSRWKTGRIIASPGCKRLRSGSATCVVGTESAYIHDQGTVCMVEVNIYPKENDLPLLFAPTNICPLGCLNGGVIVDVDERGRAGPTTNLLQFATF
jgi:hypothetical protein